MASRGGWGLAILLLTQACGGGDAAPSVEAATPSAPPAVLVAAAPPAVEEVTDVIRLAADLAPRRRAVLAAEVSGRVEAVPVEEGQAVRRGALIAAVDTRALRQAISEAEALFRQAEAQHQRAKNLYEKRSITQKNLLDAITAKDVAESQLARARLELAKSKVHAPWAGMIAGKRVEVGDYVNPGRPVAELVEVARLEVRAPAPAADVPYLAVGAPATIRVDAFPGEVFTGRVARLAAELDPAARTLDVEVEIDNPEGRLRPGMLAQMEIPRQVISGALLVPLSAVIDLGDRHVVYVIEGEHARRREVELGPTVGERVVVESGLSPADRVIVEGQQQVGDGQRVRENPTPFSKGGSQSSSSAQSRLPRISGLGSSGGSIEDRKGPAQVAPGRRLLEHSAPTATSYTTALGHAPEDRGRAA